MKIKKGMDSYIKVKQSYDWDKTAKMWEEHIDSIEIKDHSKTWDSESREFFPSTEPPENLEHSDLVSWLMENVLGEPEKANSYIALRILRDLNRGQAPIDESGIHYDELSSMNLGKPHQPFDKEAACSMIFGMLEEKNHWERKRIEISKAEGWSSDNIPSFIERMYEREEF